MSSSGQWKPNQSESAVLWGHPMIKQLVGFPLAGRLVSFSQRGCFFSTFFTTWFVAVCRHLFLCGSLDSRRPLFVQMSGLLFSKRAAVHHVKECNIKSGWFICKDFITSERLETGRSFDKISGKDRLLSYVHKDLIICHYLLFCSAVNAT